MVSERDLDFLTPLDWGYPLLSFFFFLKTSEKHVYFNWPNPYAVPQAFLQVRGLFCCCCLLFQPKSFHESVTHYFGCQGKFPPALSPAGLADIPLTDLLYKYEVLLYCSLWYMEVLRGPGGGGFLLLFWGYDAFTSTTTKLAFRVRMLCSVPYLWVVRSNFSGSNKLPGTWQGVFRKPHCSPAAKDGLPSRRRFSLLQPKLIFSFFLLAHWRKSSLIKCKHI